LEKYQIYLKERMDHISSPAFFLDCAHFFLDSDDINDEMRMYGMRILTSLAELKLEDARLYRILANKLTQEGEFAKSLYLLKKVSKLKGEEPQTWRELGLAYRQVGNYKDCAENLWKVVVTEWPERFQHIEDEVLLELNQLSG